MKLLFFCSLLLLLTPEKLPNYLFRQISTKISEKAPWRGKIIFFFFNFYFTFSLFSDRKNENYLLFPPFLIPQIVKPHEKRPWKFFFFFFYFFLPTAPRNRKKLPLTFFSEIPRKKCSKIPLSALKFHFLQITFFPLWSREHTHTLCFTDP